jgi:hypothetical protein
MDIVSEHEPKSFHPATATHSFDHLISAGGLTRRPGKKGVEAEDLALTSLPRVRVDSAPVIWLVNIPCGW